MENNHMDKLYNSLNPLVRYVHKASLEAILKEIPKEGFLRVLDAGCGEGHLLRLIENSARHKLYGADISEISLESADKSVNGARFSLQDLRHLNYEDGFFDIVICTEALEHIQNYEGAISELKRITKESGLLIVTFPNEFLWTLARALLGRRPIKVPEHCNAFSQDRIINAVRLEVRRKKNIPFNLPHLLALTRMIIFCKLSN